MKSNNTQSGLDPHIRYMGLINFRSIMNNTPPTVPTEGTIPPKHVILSYPGEFIVSKIPIQRKWIWVTFQRKGLHRYPLAETSEKLADVSYLGNVHRHLFKFKVRIEVFHDDRDIEFHQFLNWVEHLFDVGTMSLDFKSCEMLAVELIKHIESSNVYGNRSVIVEVSEDGECGAIIEVLHDREYRTVSSPNHTKLSTS